MHLVETPPALTSVLDSHWEINSVTQPLHRRSFLTKSASAGLVASSLGSLQLSAQETSSANDKVVVGVMGVNGRGTALARGFAQQPNVEIGYICDVDSRAIEKGKAAVKEYQRRVPQGVENVKSVLDDKSVDVLIVAAPNHWHAPAAILGCQAGKHVYVEKPCSHTPEEGELAVKAARKYDRVVTMGTQRRSRPILIEAITKVHEGEIGEVRYARTWYNNRRGPIGVGKQVATPDWLNFDLWQGPSTRQAFKDNLLHYNWHWHWHWGNGELGNNGVHALDVARWGMQVDFPTRVASLGGRYRFDDDQETADTHHVSYEFGDRMIVWEGLSWSPLGPGGSGFGITFHGDEGSMHVFDNGYIKYDMKNKIVQEENGSGGDGDHFANFLNCIRNGGRPNADIEEAHKSTLLCHLGNISLRTSRTLKTNPADGHILDDQDAARMWSKEYDPAWQPKV